jgi:hypothetical protein
MAPYGCAKVEGFPFAASACHATSHASCPKAWLLLTFNCRTRRIPFQHRWARSDSPPLAIMRFMSCSTSIRISASSLGEHPLQRRSHCQRFSPLSQPNLHLLCPDWQFCSRLRAIPRNQPGRTLLLVLRSPIPCCEWRRITSMDRYAYACAKYV